jgi:hypothetical protein
MWSHLGEICAFKVSATIVTLVPIFVLRGRAIVVVVVVVVVVVGLFLISRRKVGALKLCLLKARKLAVSVERTKRVLERGANFKECINKVLTCVHFMSTPAIFAK